MWAVSSLLHIMVESGSSMINGPWWCHERGSSSRSNTGTSTGSPEIGTILRCVLRFACPGDFRRIESRLIRHADAGHTKCDEFDRFVEFSVAEQPFVFVVEAADNLLHCRGVKLPAGDENVDFKILPQVSEVCTTDDESLVLMPDAVE